MDLSSMLKCGIKGTNVTSPRCGLPVQRTPDAPRRSASQRARRAADTGPGSDALCPDCGECRSRRSERYRLSALGNLATHIPSRCDVKHTHAHNDVTDRSSHQSERYRLSARVNLSTAISTRCDVIHTRTRTMTSQTAAATKQSVTGCRLQET